MTGFEPVCNFLHLLHVELDCTYHYQKKACLPISPHPHKLNTLCISNRVAGFKEDTYLFAVGKNAYITCTFIWLRLVSNSAILHLLKFSKVFKRT